jgi:hypothetical protein
MKLNGMCALVLRQRTVCLQQSIALHPSSFISTSASHDQPLVAISILSRTPICIIGPNGHLQEHIMIGIVTSSKAQYAQAALVYII